MFAKLSNLVARNAKTPVVLVFLAFLLLFAMVLVPSAQARVEVFSGGTGFIDMRFSYTPDQVSAMIKSYGDAGRAVYLTFTSTADMLYPVVYSVFFSLILTLLLQRGFKADSRLQLLNLLPFGAMIFDWLENANLLLLLSRYPEELPGVALFSSYCTSIKWGIGIVALVLVALSFVMALVNGFKKKP